MVRRTRRWLLIWCSVAAFAGFVVVSAHAQAIRFPIEGEVVGDSVSIRARSLRTSNRLSLAYKGDKLRVLGESGEWYQIELPRTYTMWVSKEFVDAGPNKEAVITGDGVRARAGAGVQYQAMGQLNRGRRIEVVDEKAEWLRFKFAAADRGYISRRYVKLEGEPGPRGVEHVQPPVQPPVQPTPQTEAIDKESLDTFNRAEELYRQEVRKDNLLDWELDKAHTLYVSVLEKTRNKNLLGKCRSRLAVIALARRYREAAKRAVSPRERLAEREKEIEAEYARKKAELAHKIKSLFPTAIASGYLEKLASALQPMTHKLVKEGRMTHLLHSKSIDLRIYEGKLVGVEGEVDASFKWPLPAIEVTGVVLPPKKPPKEEVGEEKPGEEPK